LRKSNPALGIRIPLDYLENEKEAFEGGETERLRERLGVGEYPAALDGWLVIPRRWFTATLSKLEPGAEMPVLKRPVFAVDTSPDRSMTSIAVAGETAEGLTGVQIINRRAGVGWVIPRLVELNKRWRPARIVVDRRASAGSLIADMEAQGLPVEPMTATDVAYACGLFFDAFRDDEIRHYGQSSLEKALAGADKRPLSETWAWDRKNAGVDITPLVSATFAVWGYMRYGKDGDYDARDSVHFDLDEIIRLTKAGYYDSESLTRLADGGLITTDDIPAILQAARE
jgi:hypothetical protein